MIQLNSLYSSTTKFQITSDLASIRLLSFTFACSRLLSRRLSSKNGDYKRDSGRVRLAPDYYGPWSICGDRVSRYLFTRPRIHVFHQYRGPWPLRPSGRPGRHAQQTVRCERLREQRGHLIWAQRDQFLPIRPCFSPIDPTGFSHHIPNPGQQQTPSS